MAIVPFYPNRKVLRVGNHEFLLNLKLEPDGTGLARLSEVEADGSIRFHLAIFHRDPSQMWTFMGCLGERPTPLEAAKAYLSSNILGALG